MFSLAFPAGLKAESQFIVQFTVYLDESGTHHGSRCLSIAGYMATRDQWERFSAAWQAALEDFGVEWFHMTDFERGGPPFDWPEGVKEERLSRLIGIVNAHAFASVGCVVPLSEVAAVESDLTPSLREEMGGVYGIAMTCLFMELARFLRSDPDHWAAYVAGTGVKGRGKILENFARNERKPEWKREFRLLSIRFENPRQFLPLQASDILAYELFHHLPRQIGQDVRPPRLTQLEALAEGRRKWIFISRETLQNFAVALRASRAAKRSRWRR